MCNPVSKGSVQILTAMVRARMWENESGVMPARALEKCANCGSDRSVCKCDCGVRWGEFVYVSLVAVPLLLRWGSESVSTPA